MRLFLLSLLFATIFYIGESVENYEKLKVQVRTYLEQHTDKLIPPVINVRSNDQSWLENSDKIGYGYNPLIGSPVCYTDDCQIDGFRRPIFKLSQTLSHSGPCTDKYIPDRVDLDCLPLIISNPNTKEISTISQLKNSVSNGIEIKPSSAVDEDLFSSRLFSYDYSKEITRMLDTIVKNDMKTYFTSIKVNFAKLFFFEPTAELSDNFIYVIKNMPCCNGNDPDVNDYISNFIIDYFGFTYITELILGGQIQNLVIIKSKDIDELKSVGVKSKEEANLYFKIQLDMKIKSDFNTTKQDLFQNKIQTEYFTRLGGNPSVNDIYEWMKTISENPVITKFSIKYIIDLLKPHRFPDDPQINNKAELIEEVLKAYSRQPVFCYNNCSGTDHGMCISSEAFRMGLCYCHQNFTGATCTESTGSLLPQGTVCGYYGPTSATVVVTTSIPCDGKHLPFNWPLGYTPVNTMLAKNDNSSQTAYVGYKMQTNYARGPTGTFCGHGTVVRCGDNYPEEGCPIGYNYSGEWNACWKVDSAIEDLPGTQCGLWLNHPIYNLKFPCAPQFDNDQQCPPNYRRKKWQSFDDVSIEQCFKI